MEEVFGIKRLKERPLSQKWRFTCWGRFLQNPFLQIWSLGIQKKTRSTWRWHYLPELSL